MIKTVIRLLAFFTKEFNEIRRQPRLVLSLILGPFLILLLFGIGYQGQQPILRTELVVPQQYLQDPRLEKFKASIKLNFNLVDTSTDQNAALARLKAREIDVVEILPADIETRIMSGHQAPVEFKYNEIDPLNEQWIQYLSYAQISELNRTILLDSVSQFQNEARTTNQILKETRTQLDTLNSGVSSANNPRVQQSIRQLRDASQVLANNPLLASQLSSQGTDPAQTQKQLAQLHDDLNVLDQALSNGTIQQQQERIKSTRERIAQLEDVTNRLGTLPANVIVSPLMQQYQNIYGKPPDFMTFYAPSVLALILQHIAVTLGALSLVRERLLGAIEFYGVAPVWLTEVLLGKYLGYTLFIGIIAAILIALLFFGLHVPFIGSILLFVGLLALFTLASLGIGFLISALSTSDSQAVQLSMLVLLTSIFFSGFFLPLKNFWAPIRGVGYILPLTHGIQGFQSIMLRGISPGDLEWGALSIIAASTFIAVLIIWRHQFRRIT